MSPRSEERLDAQPSGDDTMNPIQKDDKNHAESMLHVTHPRASISPTRSSNATREHSQETDQIGEISDAARAALAAAQAEFERMFSSSDDPNPRKSKKKKEGETKKKKKEKKSKHSKGE
jgi:hypothetical protein